MKRKRKLVRPIPTIIEAWKCAECGALSFDEKAPARCGNRNCDKPFVKKRRKK